MTSMSYAYTPGSRFSTAKPHFFPDCDLKDCLVTDDEPGASNFTCTKIVATIGPSTQEVGTMCDLLRAGMVGVRLDLAKGTLKFHHQSLANLQAAMRITKKLCCILVDIQGRKVLVRNKEKVDESGWTEYTDDNYDIQAGQRLTITTRADAEPSATLLPVDYEGFSRMVKVGDFINVGRYMLFGNHLRLKVESVSGTDVACVATNDATLEGLLALHIESEGIDGGSASSPGAPLIGDNDRHCLAALAADYDIDFVALGYTRDGADVRDARAFLHNLGMSNTKILAKIATRQSLFHFEGIIDKADGIIISRGPLGMDCLPEKMALVQKTVIKACNLVGKPVLLSRVVDTMINTPRPTRAEATDVANAVLDGVDGFLLGSETIKGKYPVETVHTVCSISRAAEKVFDHHYHTEHLMEVAVGEVRDASYGLAHHGHPYVAGQQHSSADAVLGDSDAEDETPGWSDQGSSSYASLQSADTQQRHRSRLGTSALRTTDVVPAPGGGGHVAGVEGEQPVLRRELNKSKTFKLSNAAQAMAWSGLDAGTAVGLPDPLIAARRNDMFKLESLASSAVRTADKIGASLIVVYTHTGRTAQLLAKYRPPMPILTLVVPNLLSDNIHWRLDGRANARQCLLSRGILPMLSTPGHTENVMLQEAVKSAAAMGLVKAHSYVVCVQRIHHEYCVKVMSVDPRGRGVEAAPRRSHTTFQQLPGVLCNSSPFANDVYDRDVDGELGVSEALVKTDSFFADDQMGTFVRTMSIAVDRHAAPQALMSPAGRARGAPSGIGRLESVEEDAECMLGKQQAQAAAEEAAPDSERFSGGLVKTLSMMPNRL